MIEIPECRTIARQVSDKLVGRTVTGVFNATHPHKFTWYVGDPLKYPALLAGRKICSAEGAGAFVDLKLDGEMHLAVSDGVNLRYGAPGAEPPAKYQLLLTLDNEGFLVLTVAMYGGISAFERTLDNPYYRGAVSKPSPLSDQFDTAYFERLFAEAKKNLSVKAFLATEQRIPGLGNGVLQDILFRARLHPKRKISTLGSDDLDILYAEVKNTLAVMTAQGGRDTERDLFGATGGYRTLLSQHTFGESCPGCGGRIMKEAYLGGAVYYCPCCQPLR